MNTKKLASALCVMTVVVGANSASAYDFGDNWTVDGTKCKVLDKKKTVVKMLWRKHTGTDVLAKIGDKVTVKADMYFYKIATDSTGWKDYVFACSTLKSGKCADDEKNIFYQFLHLDAASGLKAGQSLKNVKIGTVADISKKGAAPHVHYSKRTGKWDDNLSLKGALPPAECNDPVSRLYLPDYPEKFSAPDTSLFEITKK